jgi:hypothetical protein
VTIPLGFLLAEAINHRAQGAFWRRRETGALAGAVVAGPALVLAFWTIVLITTRLARFLGSDKIIEINQRLDEQIHSMLLFVFCMIGFDIMLRSCLYLRENVRESSSHQYMSRYFWRASTLLVVFAFLSCVKIFALTVYPTISFSFGGGQPRQVVFWLGSGTDSHLERDGVNPYTVPYELLLENENSLVVISPKDGQRAIEFDRKAVGAVVVLGKRPTSAPAHFMRNVAEP